MTEEQARHHAEALAFGKTAEEVRAEGMPESLHAEDEFHCEHQSTVKSRVSAPERSAAPKP